MLIKNNKKNQFFWFVEVVEIFKGLTVYIFKQKKLLLKNIKNSKIQNFSGVPCKAFLLLTLKHAYTFVLEVHLHQRKIKCALWFQESKRPTKTQENKKLAWAFPRI